MVTYILPDRGDNIFCEKMPIEIQVSAKTLFLIVFVEIEMQWYHDLYPFSVFFSFSMIKFGFSICWSIHLVGCSCVPL